MISGLYIWFKVDIVRGNQKPVTLRDWKVNRSCVVFCYPSPSFPVPSTNKVETFSDSSLPLEFIWVRKTLFMIFTKRRLLSRNIFHTPIVIKKKLVTFNLDSFCCFECLHIYPVFLHFSVIYLFTFYLLCLFVSVRLLAFSLFFILFFLYLFFICFCSVGQHCLRFIDSGQNGGLASQPR